MSIVCEPVSLSYTPSSIDLCCLKYVHNACVCLSVCVCVSLGIYVHVPAFDQQCKLVLLIWVVICIH